MTRKFRVVAGSHVEGKKTYTKGQKVVSEKDLVALFPGKFTEVSRPQEPESEPVTKSGKSVKPAKEE